MLDKDVYYVKKLKQQMLSIPIPSLAGMRKEFLLQATRSTMQYSLPRLTNMKSFGRMTWATLIVPIR